MKKIQIDKITYPDKTSLLTVNHYTTVTLGNGLSKQFSNSKNAEKFIVDTNKFLNESIQELNYIYVEIWSENRKNFFYENYPCYDQIYSTIENFFNRAIERCRTNNGNHLTFIFIQRIVNELNNLVNSLMNFEKRRNNYHKLYHYGIIKKRITTIEDLINNWGK